MTPFVPQFADVRAEPSGGVGIPLVLVVLLAVAIIVAVIVLIRRGKS